MPDIYLAYATPCTHTLTYVPCGFEFFKLHSFIFHSAWPHSDQVADFINELVLDQHVQKPVDSDDVL